MRDYIVSACMGKGMDESRGQFHGRVSSRTRNDQEVFGSSAAE